MADAVTTNIMFESSTDLVVQFTNISDGNGEADVVKVDVSALTPPCAEVDILKVVFATDGMAVRIEWDATVDIPAVLIPANQTGVLDFRKDWPGGLRNFGGSGKTGDVLFTTVGHTSGDTYTIVLYCKKRQTAEL
jgi:hypothetical protein